MNYTTNKSRFLIAIEVLIGIQILLYIMGVVYHVFTHYPGSAFMHYPGWFIHVLITEPINQKALTLTLMLTLSGVVALIGTVLTKKQMQTLHGDAHWATQREIRQAGLFSQTGILLGKWWGRYLCTDTDTHVYVGAPPREGKGIGIAIPNLLNWLESALVLDIRQEIFHATSGFRAKYGQKVYLWNPGAEDGRTHRFNPLDLIPKEKHIRINTLQKIADILWPTDEDDGEPWNPGARSVFIGVVLALIDTGAEATLGNVNRFITGTEQLPAMLKNFIRDHYHALDPVCISNFNSFVNQADKEQSGVFTQLRLKLSLFQNPVVDAATSASDFDVRELRTSRTTIYIGISPDNLSRLAPLLNMFVQLTVDALTRKKPEGKEARQVLFLLDEFTALGKVHTIEKGIAYHGGYKLRYLIIIQDYNQLVKLYGKEGTHTFQQSFQHKVMFTQHDTESAQYIEKSLGPKTVRVRNTSHSSGEKSSSTSANYSYQSQPLMSYNHIMRLSKRKEIVLVGGSSPILANRIVYFKDHHLKQRILPSVMIPTQDIEAFYRKIPKPLLGQDDHRDDSKGQTVPTVNEKASTLISLFESG